MSANDTPGIREHAETSQRWLTQNHMEETMVDIQELVKDCNFGLTKVSDIVTELRKFARMDDDNLTEIDINDCIDSTIKLVSNELKYHCDLHIELGDTRPVLANEGKINQVLTNLLVNAGHAIEDKGTIQVHSGTAKHKEIGDSTWFSVRDDGCGISPQNLDRIFEPFYTSKDIGKGTGLGLAISYSIIEKLGGKITVESELNKFTCFTVFLKQK